ncbi:DgyrCDS7211 [Dimorphilus gyrociliatus]|uniref:DgyrCDS7211 n=1 Tax=Dimorphilus gyrociliatus TaxID=2664684 RepID=A0A7I8VVC1_9ANNE|nr:DgyrCDS7211 [Dimorphilus gyrociliatus]
MYSMNEADKLKRYMNPRAKPGEPYQATFPESVANVITHAIFIVPAFVGFLWMLYISSDFNTRIVAWIYGSSLVIVFTTSTVFHAITLSKDLSRRKSLKTFFHVGDRAVIYLFIASSYTPWLILKEDVQKAATPVLYTVWISAIIGILYQYTFHEQYKFLETLLYVMVGLLPSLPLIFVLEDSSGLWEMFIGGVVYIAGIVFFKSDGRIPFAHAIWHCFVFVAAAMHYGAVCKYLF